MTGTQKAIAEAWEKINAWQQRPTIAGVDAISAALRNIAEAAAPPPVTPAMIEAARNAARRIRAILNEYVAPLGFAAEWEVMHTAAKEIDMALSAAPSPTPELEYAPNRWRWQQVSDVLDEAITRWPDRTNTDCHLILTADLKRLRELVAAALLPTTDLTASRPRTEGTPEYWGIIGKSGLVSHGPTREFEWCQTECAFRNSPKSSWSDRPYTVEGFVRVSVPLDTESAALSHAEAGAGRPDAAMLKEGMDHHAIALQRLVESACRVFHGGVIHIDPSCEKDAPHHTAKLREAMIAARSPVAPGPTRLQIAKAIHHALGWDGLNSWEEHDADHPDVKQCLVAADAALVLFSGNT